MQWDDNYECFSFKFMLDESPRTEERSRGRSLSTNSGQAKLNAISEISTPRLILTSSRWLVSAAKILKRLAMDVRNISPKTPAVIIEL